MLILAIAFFLLAATLGIYLLTFILQDQKTPKKIVFIHGPLAVIGLIILIIYAFFHTPAPIVSTILLILAALGGFMLIYRDIAGKSVPKWMAIGHGITAFIGLVCLIIFTCFKNA